MLNFHNYAKKSETASKPFLGGKPSWIQVKALRVGNWGPWSQGQGQNFCPGNRLLRAGNQNITAETMAGSDTKEDRYEQPIPRG